MITFSQYMKDICENGILSLPKRLKKRLVTSQLRIKTLLVSMRKGRKICKAALFLLLAAASQEQCLHSTETTAKAPWDLMNQNKSIRVNAEEYFLKAPDVSDWAAGLKNKNGKRRPHLYPAPPKLTENFSWKGRYLVPDLVDPETGKLGVDVPFTWFAKDGNVQMIAGSEHDPIYFTNLIYDDHLYTYTYKWPGLQDEFLPPLEPCGPLFEFSLDDLNAFLSTSQYVGAEILEINPCQRAHVHHFRVGIVLPHAPPGFYIRFPILSADIYVDQKDSSKIWKVLHFGLQNIYDPDLDEWIVINNFDQCPKEPKLPAACSD